MRCFTGWVMLGLLVFTTACSAAVAAPPAALATASPGPTAAPTANPTLPATAAPTATAAPQPTYTPGPAPFDTLDCAQAGCTLDGTFWLHKPIAATYQQAADGSYLYGSSQNGQRTAHTGVEFYNEFGTPVLAAADGRVIYAGSDETTAFAPWTHFYGNLVILEHTTPDGDRLYSLYAHLSEIDVAQGANVAAGQAIGKVGMSGAAIGSHLHFELRADPNDFTATRNPFLYLQPLSRIDSQPLSVLAGQLIDAGGQFIMTPQLVVERVDLPANAAPQRFYIETYAAGISSDPAWQENFVLGDLPPGRYRVTFIYNGRLIERFITLNAGQLTYLTLQVEN